VEVERRRVAGVVELDLDGLPPGVKVAGVRPLHIPPQQSSGYVVLAATSKAAPGMHAVKVGAVAGGVFAETVLRLTVVPPRPAEERLSAENEAIRQTPDDPTAYVNRARAFRDLGNYEQAFADYVKALKLDPTFARAYHGRGTTHRLARQYDAALADLSEAIRLDPRYPPAYADRGMVFQLKREYDQALADHNQALKLDPEFAPAYDGRGQAYQAKGMLDKAIAEYDTAIRLDPTNALAFGHRALAFELTKAYDKALADYDQAVHLDPTYAQGYNGRGFLYARQGDLDKALTEYAKAIQLDPKFAMAYRNRGNTYLDRGDNARAIADFDTVLRLQPRDDVALAQRGLAYERMKAHDWALGDYSEAIRMNPDRATPYLRRGALYYSYKKDLDKAIADFSSAIKIDPQLVAAYRNRGNLYHDKKEYDLAIADYTKALEIGPKLALVYRNRGNSYRMQQEYAKAIADLNEAIRIDPKYGNAYKIRGLAYQARGDAERAEADLKRAEQLAAAPKKVRRAPPAGAAGKDLLRTTGELTASSPRDRQVPTYCQVHDLQLAAGKTYVMALEAEEQTFTPFLRLEDANGKEVMQQGGGDPRTAQLVYRPAVAGVYRLIATTHRVGQTGRFALHVREVGALPRTGIKDGAKYFAAAAVRKAESQLQDFAAQTGVGLMIETYATVPAEDLVRVRAMGEAEKGTYFRDWTLRRARETGADGVFLLICRDPSYFYVELMPPIRPLLAIQTVNRVKAVMMAPYDPNRPEDRLLAVIRVLEENVVKTARK
jgi:tetratricopeptide (TPR) repeat protein